jgi:hypothetical protein
MSFASEEIPLETQRARFKARLARPPLPVLDRRVAERAASCPGSPGAGVRRGGLRDFGVRAGLFKPDNQASLRAFERADFGDSHSLDFRGHPALLLTLP